MHARAGYIGVEQEIAESKHSTDGGMGTGGAVHPGRSEDESSSRRIERILGEDPEAAQKRGERSERYALRRAVELYGKRVE